MIDEDDSKVNKKDLRNSTHIILAFLTVNLILLIAMFCCLAKIYQLTESN